MTVRKDILVLLGLAIIITVLVIVALLFFNPDSDAEDNIDDAFVYERSQYDENIAAAPPLLEDPFTLSDELSETDFFEFTIGPRGSRRETPEQSSEKASSKIASHAAPTHKEKPSVAKVHAPAPSKAPLETLEKSKSKASAQPRHQASAKKSRPAIPAQSKQQTALKTKESTIEEPASSTSTEAKQTTNISQPSESTPSQVALSAPQQSSTDRASLPTLQQTSIVHSGTQYWIQLLATRNRTQLEHIRALLRKSSIPSVIKLHTVNDALLYRLRVGPFIARAEAQMIMGTILESDVLNDGFIVSVRSSR